MLVRFWDGEGGGGVEVQVVFEATGCGGVLPGAHCGGEGGGRGHDARWGGGNKGGGLWLEDEREGWWRVGRLGLSWVCRRMCWV